MLQVAESATQFFIANDRPTVSGLVLAGSADFKTELSQSDMFDQRLQAIVLAVVDVSYGASLSFCSAFLPATRVPYQFPASFVACDQMACTQDHLVAAPRTAASCSPTGHCSS